MVLMALAREVGLAKNSATDEDDPLDLVGPDDTEPSGPVLGSSESPETEGASMAEAPVPTGRSDTHTLSLSRFVCAHWVAESEPGPVMAALQPRMPQMQVEFSRMLAHREDYIQEVVYSGSMRLPLSRQFRWLLAG